MMPKKDATEERLAVFRELKEAVTAFVFSKTEYGDKHVSRRKQRISAEELESLTGCGPEAALLVADIFPVAAGHFRVGDLYPLGNFGLDIFISLVTGDGKAYLDQGFCPVLSDAGGNLILVSTSESNLKTVLVIAMDTAPADEYDLETIAFNCRDNLIDLLKGTKARPEYDMFEGCTPYKGEKKSRAPARHSGQ